MAEDQALQQRLVTLCNTARGARGLAALQTHPLVAQVARAHAEAMALGGYFDHVDTAGAVAGDRLQRAGFVYRWAGENISAGKPTLDEVFAWWMTSDAHRANILKAEFTLVGAGHCYIEQDRLQFHHYWVAVFATPMPA